MKAVLLALTSLIVAICALWLSYNSAADVVWLRSATNIQSTLESRLPLGSSRRAVEAFFTAQGATVISSSMQAGFVSGHNEVIGMSHLRVRLGGYRLPLSNIDVTATAGFNLEGRMVRLEVKKYFDSL